MAQALGLRTNTMNHALPYGNQSGDFKPSPQHHQITYDDNRRGAYVPNSYKKESSPVKLGGAIAAPLDPRIEPLQPAIRNALPLPAPHRNQPAPAAEPRARYFHYL